MKLLRKWLGLSTRHEEEEARMQEELRLHIEMQIRDNLAAGMLPEEARRAALRQFGGVEAVKERCRDERSAGWIEDGWRDVKIVARMLRKNPGFTAAAVLTLALGIGANTAIFSLVNTLLLRPLPFRDAGKLVWISNIYEGGMSGETSTVGNYKDWRAQNKSFEDLAAYFPFFDYGGFNLTGAGEPERLRGASVSKNFLDVLGVAPMLGRNFVEEECREVAARAALLTHGYWLRKFAGNPSVIGKVVNLNGNPVTIVGVMGPGFDFSSVFSPATHVDLVVPFPMIEETDRWGNTLTIIGRLKPEVRIEQARAEFEALTEGIKQAHPERYRFGAVLTPMQERINRNFRDPFVALICAVGCVLLIACANLSNLLLARNATRRKEMAVRMALGARRSQLMRQMLVESLLLSGFGALLGLPMAFALTNAMAHSNLLSIPLLAMARVDAQALLFTIAIAGATGLLFGIAPAILGSRDDVHEDLKDAGRGSSGGTRRAWLREALVISEVSLACVLLVAAGLLIRSFKKLLEVDPGFRAEHAMAWRVETSRKFDGLVAQTGYYDQLAARVRSIPGVQAVGFTDSLPLGRNRTWGIGGEGVSYPEGGVPVAFPRVVDAGYLRAMQIPLRAGRDFDERDTTDTEKAIIVNEALSKVLFPGEPALGRMVRCGGDFRVVGIVSNVRHSSLDNNSSYEMYLLGKQIGFGAMELVVRSSLPVESLIPSVRTALREMDPELPTTQFQALEEVIERAVSPKRLVTRLLAAFSALALALASLGIYGVLSYSVNQRRQEMGIRLAIGAPVSAILKLILSQGMRLALIGILVGLAASVAVSRVMESLLYEVSATDPLTFIGNALLLVAIAFLACWLPARRAARTNPMIALRAE